MSATKRRKSANRYRPKICNANFDKLVGLVAAAPVPTDVPSLVNEAIRDWNPDWAKPDPEKHHA